jgi:hypothetical protein
MRNTQGISILSVTFALALGACVTEGEETSTTSLALSAGTCETKPDFPTWKDVQAIEEKEPELFKAASEAAIAAGTKCTEESRYGCKQPRLDGKVLSPKWVFPYVGCWKGANSEGRPYAECCLVGVPTDQIVCDWSWINVGPTVPDQTPSKE